MLRRFEVVGGSMAPSLAHGQRILVRTGTFRRRAPRRGEIVVLEFPGSDRRVVKRVTGIPGDALEGRRLGSDEYFAEGDNPSGSTDSRTHGPVPRSAILGSVLFSYRPWALFR